MKRISHFAIPDAAKKYVHPESVIVGVASVAMIIANFWHILWYWWHRPADTVYIGITHYYEDYFYYLSIVKQGMDGNWLSRNLYTTEVMPQTPLWLVNILIGKIGALAHLTPWTSYNFFVLAVAVAWLLVTYWIIRKLEPGNASLRIGTFLFATTSSAYYLLQRRPSGELFVNPYLYFYNYTSALNRIGGVFHLILQNILSILAIYLAGKIIQAVFQNTVTQKVFLRQALVLMLLLTGLMFINPTYVFVDLIAIALTGLLYFLAKPRFAALRSYVSLALLLGSALGVSYLLLAQTFSLPFYRYFRYIENSISPTIPDIFFHSMGLILVPAFVGLVPYFQKKNPLRTLGAFYTLVPIILYFSSIPAKIGIPYFRLHQPPAYIFLGLAAAEGCWLIGSVLEKILKKHVREAVLATLVAGFILFQLPMIRLEIADRMGSYWLPSWLNAMDKPTYEGFAALDKLPKDKNVLAFNNLEILVPPLTGHAVYVGHKSLTYNYPEKIATAYRFYNGQMSAQDARIFLSDNNIGYVLWHKADGPEHLRDNYPFMEKVFENGAMVIYRAS